MKELNQIELDEVSGGINWRAVGYAVGHMVKHPVDSVNEAWDYWTN